MGISVIGGGAAGGGKYLKTQVITGTSSWVAPADVTQVEVWAFGGGGGGGGWNNTSFGWTGGGGGGGGCGRGIVAVTPGSSYAVVVGAGGAGQGGPTNNTFGPAANGQSSSFNGTIVGYGGQGGLGGGGTGYVNPGYFVRSSSNASPFSQDYVGSGGGGAGDYTSGFPWSCGGGGGGAGGDAARNGLDATNNDNTYLSIGSYGQGGAGAHGVIAQTSDVGIIWRGIGGKGIDGIGGGGGGGLAAHDWSGNWAATYSHIRYRGRGTDGGGDGAMDIYNNAGGTAPAGQAQRYSTSGATNKAGGGGGGCRTNWWASDGGNGGSGVVILKYWTAI